MAVEVGRNGARTALSSKKKRWRRNGDGEAGSSGEEETTKTNCKTCSVGRAADWLAEWGPGVGSILHGVHE